MRTAIISGNIVTNIVMGKSDGIDVTSVSCGVGDLYDQSTNTFSKPVLAPAPIQIPQTVTMRQARLALLSLGRLSAVNSAVAVADDATKISWEFSGIVERNDPLVKTLATTLGITDSDLDSIFTLAKTL